MYVFICIYIHVFVYVYVYGCGCVCVLCMCMCMCTCMYHLIYDSVFLNRDDEAVDGIGYLMLRCWWVIGDAQLGSLGGLSPLRDVARDSFSSY